MARTNEGDRSVKIESMRVWAADDGQIHLVVDDPDVNGGVHTTVSNDPSAKRYHPSAYVQFARLLMDFGKRVPGYDPATAPADDEGNPVTA